MSEMVERVAKAIMAALEAAESYCDPSHGVDCVILDGDFNLRDVARAAIAAMHEPTEAMQRELCSWACCSGYVDKGWNAAIDEALK